MAIQNKEINELRKKEQDLIIKLEKIQIVIRNINNSLIKNEYKKNPPIKENIRQIKTKIKFNKQNNNIITADDYAKENNITKKQASDKLWALWRKGELKKVGRGQYER